MRESFKKAKVREGFMAFQTIQKLPCSSLWLRGGYEDYPGQLSLLAPQALELCVVFQNLEQFLTTSVPDRPQKFHLCQFFCVQT